MEQAAGWMDFIEEFDLCIIHSAGVAHGNCNALSRRSEPERTATSTVSNPVYPSKDATVVDTTQTLVRQMTECQQVGLDAVATAQQADPTLKPLILALKANRSRPDWSEMQAMPEETRILWTQ